MIMKKSSFTFKKLNTPNISEKFIVGAAIVLLSVGGGYVGGYFGQKNQASLDSSQASKAIQSESELIAEIVRNVGPSVVSIKVNSNVTAQTFFGPREVDQVSAGTGFILSADGVVATNRHVIPDDNSQISVTLSDGTELDNVEVIGRTAANDPLDIAFLKIKDTKGKELKPVKLANPDTKIDVGQKVVAIGNALGQFQNTVTSGIISGFGRDIETAGGQGESEGLQNLLQTDASINQGNSGGPLVSINGEVIGINTAVAGSGAENIGFAIPINDVRGIIKSVLERGELLRPYLGVRYITLTDESADEFNLETKRGAYLAPGESATLQPGSPAEKAGLKEKDIITKINNIDVNETTSLGSALGRFSVGETIKVTVVRGDQTLTIDVQLEALPTR